MSYKGVSGYHPLITALANTGEFLYMVNGPGNLPSHAGAAEWIDRRVDLVNPHVEIRRAPHRSASIRTRALVLVEHGGISHLPVRPIA